VGGGHGFEARSRAALANPTTERMVGDVLEATNAKGVQLGPHDISR